MRLGSWGDVWDFWERGAGSQAGPDSTGRRSRKSEQKIGAEKREPENLAPWRTAFTCLEGELHPKPDRASGLKQIRLSVSAVNSVAGSSSTKISLVQQALDVGRSAFA
jgi:hypothetical protein